MSTLFPLSASVGQIFNGYQFDGSRWNIIGVDLTDEYAEIINGKISASVIPDTIATVSYVDQEISNIDLLPSQSGNSGKYLTTNGTVASWGTVDSGGSSLEMNTQTSSYTLQLADASKIINMNISSLSTLTIPLNSSVAFPTGTIINVLKSGKGHLNIAGASGVTLSESVHGAKRLYKKNSSVRLIKKNTNEWLTTDASDPSNLDLVTKINEVNKPLYGDIGTILKPVTIVDGKIYLANQNPTAGGGMSAEIIDIGTANGISANLEYANPQWGGYTMLNYSYANGILFSVGRYDTFGYSTDLGETWSQQSTNPGQAFYFGPGATATATYFNNKWIVLGGAYDYAQSYPVILNSYSTDGTTWTNAHINNAGVYDFSGAWVNIVQSDTVLFGEMTGLFGPLSYYTTDGITWTLSATAPPQAYNGTHFARISVEGNINAFPRVSRSTDGLTYDSSVLTAWTYDNPNPYYKIKSIKLRRSILVDGYIYAPIDVYFDPFSSTNTIPGIARSNDFINWSLVYQDIESVNISSDTRFAFDLFYDNGKIFFSRLTNITGASQTVPKRFEILEIS